MLQIFDSHGRYEKESLQQNAAKLKCAPRLVGNCSLNLNLAKIMSDEKRKSGKSDRKCFSEPENPW